MFAVQMQRNATSEVSTSWHETITKTPLARWLYSHGASRRGAAAVVAVSVFLLLYTGGTVTGPGALSDHYHRVSSALRAARPGALEPLSETYCSLACRCACRPWLSPGDADPPEPVTSNCGRTADRRGAHQDVLAFSYYGTNVTAYLDGIATNAMKALELYPGWTVRVYYDGQASFRAWNKTACDLLCR